MYLLLISTSTSNNFVFKPYTIICIKPTHRYPDYSDLPATHVDAAAGVGGLFYLIGSIMFLNCVTDPGIYY
jgi:hypothetical protein